MRAVAIAVLLAARVAAADGAPSDPIDLPLADAPVEIGPEHMTIRALEGSVVQPERGRVVFETDGSLFVIEGSSTSLVVAPDLATQIARSLAAEPLRVAKARIEPFRLSSGRTALAVRPTTPARANELIFAVYMGGLDGAVKRLAFYVEDVAVAGDPSWRSIAARIAQTARPDGLATVTLGPWIIDLPPDAMHDANEARQWFSTKRTLCVITTRDVGEPAPANAVDAPGTLLGQAITWRTYGNGTSTNAGTTFVTCYGETPADLAYGRALVSTLAPKR